MSKLDANDVVIVDAVRTATARRNGRLAGVHVTDLLGTVLVGLLERSPIDAADVDHVAGGCINQVGMQANNITRTSWLAAGLPLEVPASTTSTQCGSGQQASMWAHSLVASGLAEIVIACGVESMSNVPLGSNVPYNPDGEPMYGERYTDTYSTHHLPTTQLEGAEMIAAQWGLLRSELDPLGSRSQQRAQTAWAEGRFDSQIIPVSVPVAGSAEPMVHDRDEGLRETTLDALAGLKALTGPDGYHTAGTASQIADAAGALMVMRASKAHDLGIAPLARIVDSCLVGSDPALMLTGPIPATQKLLEDNSLGVDDIDVFEINEAFASVIAAWCKDVGVGLDDERLNPNGGAMAIGHALGSTGPILIAKAAHELRRRGGRYGLISMCCGGGLGTGTLIESI